MQTNQAGIDLIKRYEGLELEAYLCPANVWTIGYGHTGPDVGPGMQITESEAEDLLRKDLHKFERAVERLVMVPMNPNEFAALVSLTYNIGEGNFSKSSCLRYLNQGNRKEAANRIELWNKARVGGELTVLEGLVRRRAAEKALFLDPVDSELMAVPTMDVPPDPAAEETAAARVSANPEDLAKQQYEQAEKERVEEQTDQNIATGVAVSGSAAAASVARDAADQAAPSADEAAEFGGFLFALREFVDGLPEWLLTGFKVIIVLGLMYIAVQLIQRRKVRLKFKKSDV